MFVVVVVVVVGNGEVFSLEKELNVDVVDESDDVEDDVDDAFMR